MKSTGIFREELPGEKKSIINLLMLGYMVSISCLGYMAFYLYIQMGQVDRIVDKINPQAMTPEQVALLKETVTRRTTQLQNEMVGLAILGTIISIIGGIYTINLIIKPLKKLIAFAETKGATELPEFKSNTELKQLATGLSTLVPASGKDQEQNSPETTLKSG